jgi:hypothetical protein
MNRAERREQKRRERAERRRMKRQSADGPKTTRPEPEPPAIQTPMAAPVAVPQAQDAARAERQRLVAHRLARS